MYIMHITNKTQAAVLKQTMNQAQIYQWYVHVNSVVI